MTRREQFERFLSDARVWIAVPHQHSVTLNYGEPTEAEMHDLHNYHTVDSLAELRVLLRPFEPKTACQSRHQSVQIACILQRFLTTFVDEFNRDRQLPGFFDPEHAHATNS